MIKKTLITLFFCILLINIVSASELTLLDTEYVPGETLQAYITNTSVSSSQISLLDNSSTLISITPLITEYRNEQYLIYFNLDSDLTEGTYKLIAKSMEANFTITRSDFSFQIKPGIIILDDNLDSFKLELTNVGDPVTLQISASDPEISPRKSALSLTDDETKNLYSDYTYENINSDSTITISHNTGSYTIPIIYTGEIIQEQQVNTTVEEINLTIEDPIDEITEEITLEAISFITTKEKAEIPLAPEESYSGYLKFINNLNESIYNLEFSLTGNLEEIIELNLTSIEEIKGGETLSQYIWVNKEESNRTGEYTGELLLSNELYSTSLSIEVTIAEEETEEIVEEEEEITETQDPIVIDESDLYYPVQDEGVSGTTVLGIIMIIILLGIFILIFIKMRQKEEKKFNQYIQETKRK